MRYADQPPCDQRVYLYDDWGCNFIDYLNHRNKLSGNTHPVVFLCRQKSTGYLETHFNDAEEWSQTDFF